MLYVHILLAHSSLLDREPSDEHLDSYDIIIKHNKTEDLDAFRFFSKGRPERQKEERKEK